MRHLIRISRFSWSLASLQPQISEIDREQPRQTLFSSRQQLRTHGEGTPPIASSAIGSRPPGGFGARGQACQRPGNEPGDAEPEQAEEYPAEDGRRAQSPA